MRILTALLILAAGLRAGEFGRTLRDLRADDRARRKQALEAFADGRAVPGSRSQSDKLARTLELFLSSKYPGVERALAVRALGRLEQPKVFLRIMARLQRDRDDRVLRAAARVFRRAPAALLPDLLRRVDKAKDPLERAVFLRMMGELPAAAARERIRLRASIPDHWCPRAAAVHALAHDHDPATLPLLMELIDASDPGLVTAAAESLTRLTGRQNGRDPLKWHAWWRKRQQNDPLAEPKPKPEPGPGKPERRRYAHEVKQSSIRPYFFGVPVRGSKVVFVFDVSASMRYKLPLAYDQLRRAIKALPSTSRFEVIFFNEHVWPWRERLSYADPVTKELLVRHLPEIEIKSYTNLFDSIAMAVGMKPNEVFVISDGEPNRGRWQLGRDILRELAKLNSRRIPIHTVSVVRVVDGDEHVPLLKRIADAHQGTYVERTLK